MSKVAFDTSITWPKDDQIAKRPSKYRSLLFIQNLFYNAGIATSICYIFIAMVLQPLLQRQTAQRSELSATCLLKIRKTVTFLESRMLKSSASAQGYNERTQINSSATVVDRCTQTEECQEYVSGNQKPSGWTKIIARLNYARDLLNISAEDQPEGSSQNRYLPLRFQIQSFNSSLAGIDGREKDDSEAMTKGSIRAIRDMKGWIINGRAV
ncbi:LAFA_0F15434g1_1 [Lachancea sp. 'fantastica']|nr:LAFA_0F15434g1_1 [Lachancea sp. 'fantastica']